MTDAGPPVVDPVDSPTAKWSDTEPVATSSPGIVRKALYGLGAQMISLTLGLGTTVMIARGLGPSGKGILTLLLGLPPLAIAFGLFGLAASFTYLSAKKVYSESALLGSATALSVLMGFPIGAVVFFLGAALQDSLLKGISSFQLGLVAFSLPAYFCVSLCSALLFGSGRIARLALLQVSSSVCGFVLMAAALLFRTGVSGALVASLVNAILVAGLFVFAIGREVGFALRRFTGIAADAFRYGSKAFVGQLANHVWLRGDMYLLNLSHGASQVGVYSVATSLAEKVWILDESIGMATFSDVSGAEVKHAGQLTARIARVLTMLDACLSGLLVLVASFLIPLVYGQRFSEAVGLLALLLPGVVLMSGSRILGNFYSGQLGRPGVVSAVAVATTLVSVGAYVVLIPRFGAAGAAVGSSIGYATPIVVYAALFPRSTGIRLRQALVPEPEDFALMGSALKRIAEKILPGGSRES